MGRSDSLYGWSDRPIRVKKALPGTGVAGHLSIMAATTHTEVRR